MVIVPCAVCKKITQGNLRNSVIKSNIFIRLYPPEIKFQSVDLKGLQNKLIDVSLP